MRAYLPTFKYLMRFIFAFVTVLFLLTYTAQAGRISNHMYSWADPVSKGVVDISLDVFDNYLGDTSKYEWRYAVTNISYDPFAGVSNGLSGFNIVFNQPILDLGDQYGPAGWLMNCCTSGPPVNAEWDIRNSLGFGVAVGGTDVFGYTTAPRDLVPGSNSWMHSWVNDVQTSTFSGVLGTPGDFSVPEPVSLILLGLGLIGLSVLRRK